MQAVIKDTLIYFEVLGETNNNNIIILHGWGQNHTHWLPLAQKLSLDNKIWLIDLPGFGATPTNPKINDSYQYADLIKNFIIKKNIKNPIVIGHSFGGKIAIILATKINLKKLILISPSGVENKNPLVYLKIFIAKILKLPLSPLPQNLKNDLIKLVGSKDYLESSDKKNIFQSVINQKVDREAKKINTQTIIIWGERDRELSVKNAKILKSLIKKSIIKIVWGADHNPHIEKPNSLETIILEHL